MTERTVSAETVRFDFQQNIHPHLILIVSVPFHGYPPFVNSTDCFFVSPASTVSAHSICYNKSII